MQHDIVIASITHTHISGLKNETTEGRSVGIVGPDPDGRMGGGRTVEGGPGRTVAGRWFSLDTFHGESEKIYTYKTSWMSQHQQ